MRPSNDEIDNLRKTIEQLSDQIVRSKAEEERLLNEFSAMNNELVTLQRQLVKSNAELRKARLAAEQANEAKSNLLAMISHEIRTPISSIIGMTELMDGEEMSESHKETVNIIQGSARLLLNIINDLLDLSKIEAGKMNLKTEPVYLTSIIDQISKLLEVKIKNNGNILSCHIDEEIHEDLIGDAGRITQIILNLLSNANKFTSYGHINLRISLLEQLPETQRLRFEVEDTGIGIAPEEQSRLFQPYTQTMEGSSPQYGGTGLGLSICKSFVELMHGRIGVDSEPGKGSCFWFEITLHKGHNPTTPDDTHAVASSNRDNSEAPQQEELHTQAAYQVSLPILVAEDHPMNRKVIVMQLRKLGIQQVDTASDGEEAVLAVKNKKYAMIFMDHMMPKVNGLEAAQEIRRHEQQMHQERTRMIALTGNVGENIREQYMNAGMDDYIVKPASLNALSDILRKWLPADQPDEHTILDEEIIHELQELDEDEDDESNLLSMLFKMYTADMPEKMKDLQQHLKNQDHEQAAAAAHKLKSSSLSLGIVHVSNLLARIEKSSREGQFDSAMETMELLYPSYDEACQALAAIIQRRNES